MHAVGTVDVGWAAVVRCLSFIDGDVVDSSFAMLPCVPPLWNLQVLVHDAVRREWSMCCPCNQGERIVFEAFAPL